ncbi:hypothetical protein UFOVP1290_210 [uncultured Caudovirales phage]|uniref:Uncharacterized protein n=1 Tax=uncultured Caudovirales phage TaxID=2100421 RepID=A0A6J5RGK4_9CAUD|nr:hypothetical protein UFOVP1290_210 [uncultured Caudovirales phage]
MKQLPFITHDTTKPMVWRETIVKGQVVSYNSDTTFYIQVGRGKSSYKTKYAVNGSFGMACTYYHGINIGNGYKKRLVMDKKVLDRRFSS